MLSRIHRFHGHGSLRYVYRNGQAVRSRHVIIKSVDNRRRSHSRVSVVISKKVLKSAVRRNRVRRRVYEVVRHLLPEVGTPHDIVVIIVSSEILQLPDSELSRTIRGLFVDAKLCKM